METLKNLNKLWRTTPLLQLQPIATTYSDVSDYRVYGKEVAVEDDVDDAEEEEEEESFFELEVVMLNSKTRDAENGSFNNGRRVVPVEPDTKLKPLPDSPVSILKSTPKFKVSLFKNHINSNNNNTDLKLKQRPKIDDLEKLKLSKTTISTLIRQSNGTSSHASKQSMSKCKTEDDVYNDDSVSNDDDDSSSSSSKRFSKDVMHKYLKLKLIKPFHLKLAKRCASVNSNKSSKLFSVHKASSSSVSSSPVPSSSISSSSSTSSSSSSASGYGFRVVCKQLGKSRSASSMTVGIGGSGGRRDESLMMVEHDDGGIQSAILHCKRSFNSSRDSSDSNSSEESRS